MVVGMVWVMVRAMVLQMLGHGKVYGISGVKCGKEA